MNIDYPFRLRLLFFGIVFFYFENTYQLNIINLCVGFELDSSR